MKNETFSTNQRDLKIEFNNFGINPEDHDEFKKEMLAAAAAGVAEFPKRLESFKNLLRTNDPFGLLASASFYGLSSFVSNAGIVAPQKNSINIEQHHVEFMQGVLLSIPVGDFDPDLLMPHTMQKIFDDLPELTQTFIFRRMLQAEQVQDKAEMLVLSLQERMRLHTQIVRNWGYFDQVTRLVEEMIRPISGEFKDKFGFEGSDLVEVARSIVEIYQERQNEHWNILRKVLREKKPRKMINAYFKLVPELKGDAENLLSGLPINPTREQMVGLIMAHFDLRLSERATFTVEEITSRLGRAKEIVQAVLDELSLPLGSLEDSNPEFLFLGNPVWEKPFIKLDGAFFSPVPQAVFSHINRIIDRLVRDSGIKKDFAKYRSKFLEEKIESLFRSSLPGADIRSGEKWRLGDVEYETDLLVVIDKTIVIVEAKSHRLTVEGLRGAPDRVRRHITEMVIDPSIQSERLERIIWKAKSGDHDAISIARKLGIDEGKVDRVIRLSVTLDDLSPLNSAEAEFKKVGWLDDDHSLAPAFLISDLSCIVEILDNPLFLLHYLDERSHFQRSQDLLGDELDFLGLYLLTGFNTGVNEDENINLVVSGLSENIDQYFMSKEAGFRRKKPSPEISPLFRNIISSLIERKPEGWTTVGLHLLSCGNPAEQKAIERNLVKLRSMVRKNYRDSTHLHSLQITPPENRKARVLFHLYPEKLRSEAKRTMEALVNDVFNENEEVKSCVVFGRGIDAWSKPYEYVMLASR